MFSSFYLIFFILYFDHFWLHPTIFKITILRFIAVSSRLSVSKTFYNKFFIRIGFRIFGREFWNKIFNMILLNTWNIIYKECYGTKLLKQIFYNTYNIFGNQLFKTNFSAYIKYVSEQVFTTKFWERVFLKNKLSFFSFLRLLPIKARWRMKEQLW